MADTHNENLVLISYPCLDFHISALPQTFSKDYEVKIMFSINIYTIKLWANIL